MSGTFRRHPALTEWWRRGDYKTRDDLWVAACWAASAEELFAAGCNDRATECENRATELSGIEPSHSEVEDEAHEHEVSA